MNSMEARILDELRTIVGDHGLISSPEELQTYECDGLTNFRVMPRAVLLPNSTEQVQAIVRVCHRERMPFVARGSGTGLSGGALPVENGIVISLARMNRILEVDFPNARVVVEPGEIHLKNPVHPRQADDNPVFNRQGTAAQARARAPGDERHPFAVTDAHARLNLLRGIRQQHRARHHAEIGQTVALVSMQFFRRGNQAVVANDRPKLVKNTRFHRIHSPECQNQLAPSVNEVQPTRDKLRENIRIHHDDDPDNRRQRHGVPENKPEDGAFVAYLIGCRGGDTNGLRVDHFSHHAAGAVRRAHQNRAEVELLRRDFLQSAEEYVRRRVAAREGYAEPADKRTEKWKQPSGTRESETQNCIHARVARDVSQAKHASHRDNSEPQPHKSTSKDLQKSARTHAE